MSELIQLRENILTLEKEGCSDRDFRRLNILAIALRWSSESWKIVDEAAYKIEEEFITDYEKGIWR